MRRVVSRLVAALALAAAVAVASAATASADSDRPDVGRHHTTPAHETQYDTADWWF